MEVLQERAHELMVPLNVAAPLDSKNLKGVKISLSGDHQLINAGLAVSLCKCWLQRTGNWEKILHNDSQETDIPEAFCRGLSTACLSGRAEIVYDKFSKYYNSSATDENSCGNLIFYLDGAHSPESMEACARWFSSVAKGNGKVSPLSLSALRNFGNGCARHIKDKVEESHVISKQILLFNCMEVRDPQVLLTHLVNACSSSGTHLSKALFVPNMSKYNKVTSALLDVASSLANNAQTKKGWNRIIIEKPFGFDALSSQWFTKSLLSNFEEKQIYRIDHLLGRNLIENLTVLRFSNLVFEPLWSRTYIHNVQVLLSEDLGMQTGRYFDGYGVIRDIVHSHMLQTIALLAMEPPVSLDGEDIRNEKVKVLRSIRKLEPSDVILGQYKATSGDKVDVSLSSLTPTFFAAALYIDNGRWDGVPFLIKAGVGLIKHRVEIRIQFNHVPGNLYRERFGHNTDLATNELILRDAPDEAILVKINNKIPGLGLQLDASELNLLYKDKYNVEVPDSYEHLLLDVIDGDSHLFLRSDELAAAWSILTPVLQEIDRNNIAPELYELGGRGPVGAYYLWAKHGVRWADD